MQMLGYAEAILWWITIGVALFSAKDSRCPKDTIRAGETSFREPKSWWIAYTFLLTVPLYLPAVVVVVWGDRRKPGKSYWMTNSTHHVLRESFVGEVQSKLVKLQIKGNTNIIGETVTPNRNGN